MKKFLTLVVFSILSITVFAQEIDVDRNTGLVTVDGKDAFYLIKKNKGLVNFDLSLQNLNKEEIAFLAWKDVSELQWEERGNNSGTFFRMVFSETGNVVNLFPSGFSMTKLVAKAIVNGNLVKENRIDPKAEKTFVLSKNGKLYKDPESRPINITVTAPAAEKPNKQPADIAIKGNSIYNNSELIGSFKNTTDTTTKQTTIIIYKKDDSKVATAKHNDKDTNADWQIVFADNKTTDVLYNSATPLEKLFKFLADKGYL